MIKYFCDICGEELNRKDHFTYTLPMRVEKVEYEYEEAHAAFYNLLNKGKTVRQIIQDQEVMICPRCRSTIAYTITPYPREELK